MLVKPLSSQQGSALMLAVFIVVVMSLLAASLMRMLDSSQESVAVEVYGTRALLAANTGIELMASQVFPVSSSVSAIDALPLVNCPANFSQNLPNQDGMSNCDFTVSCLQTAVNVVSSSVTYYRFNSVGRCDVGDWQTSRTVEVEAKVL